MACWYLFINCHSFMKFLNLVNYFLTVEAQHRQRTDLDLDWYRLLKVPCLFWALLISFISISLSVCRRYFNLLCDKSFSQVCNIQLKTSSRKQHKLNFSDQRTFSFILGSSSDWGRSSWYLDDVSRFVRTAFAIKSEQHRIAQFRHR